MEVLRKYGVATDIYVPIIKRGVVDFAVSADWTPAAGDVKISKDGGAAANITTLPTAITMGNGAIWKFPLSATEMQAAKIAITVVDSATKAVEDQCLLIQTYGHASADLTGVDFTDSAALGMTRLDAAVTTRASQTSVDTVAGYIDTEVAAIKAKTDNLPGVAAGTNGGLPLVGSQIPNANANATGGLAAAVIRGGTAQGGGASTITLDASAAATNDLYRDMLVCILAGTGAGQTRSIQSYVGSTKVATVSPSWGTNPDNTSVFVLLPLGQVTTYSIGDKTGYALTSGERDSVADALLDKAAGVETNRTVRQSLRLMLAALVGKLSGAATTTVAIRDTNDTKNRISATVDADGNRSVVTLDGT